MSRKKTTRQIGSARRLVTGLTAGSALVAGMTLSPPAATASDAAAEVRIPGKTAEEIAVGLSKRVFSNGADVVYVARADLLADALAGGSLSGGPILYVDEGANTAVTMEIRRLAPKKVVALGGEAAVSRRTLDSFGVPSARLAGSNRFATAVAVSRHAFPAGAKAAYLVNAEAFADAASAGGFTDGPILPVGADGSVPAEVAAELKRLGVTSVVVMGGTTVLPATLFTNLKKIESTARTYRRIAGSDRYETSALAAAEQFPQGAKTVYLAPGAYDLGEAVAAGVVTDGPVLLAMFNASTESLRMANLGKTETVVALTYEGLVCARVMYEVQQIIREQKSGTRPDTPPATPPAEVPPSGTPSAPVVDTTGKPAEWSTVEWEILQLTNAERAQQGLSALAPDTCLRNAAHSWSTHMATTGVFEHGDVRSRVSGCAVTRRGWAENIAWGYPDARAAVRGWMSSPGHRANILNPGLTHLGVGVQNDHYTQNFGVAP